MPVVPASGAGTHGQPLADPHRLDVRSIANSSRLGVDLGEDVLIHGFLQAQEGAVPTVQLPEDPVLSDAEHRGSALDVHEHPLVRLVEVQRFAGHVREVPDDLPRVRVQRQGGVGV